MIAILREAGLVEVEKAGKFRVYRLSPTPLAEAAAWLNELEKAVRKRGDRVARSVDRVTTRR